MKQMFNEDFNEAALERFGLGVIYQDDELCLWMTILKDFLVEAELKNLAAGSVFSVQDFRVSLSKKQFLSFLSHYLIRGG